MGHQDTPRGDGLWDLDEVFGTPPESAAEEPLKDLIPLLDALLSPERDKSARK
jgi:hypothetical protein